MSWSLQLRNGDLATSGARLGQVTGGTKLVQDLRCALLERRGTDDMHPTFGSLIDGGRDEFGNEVDSIIGSSNWQRIAMRVEGEIRRICAEHQQRQVDRAQDDRLRFGESTLTNDELLVKVESVQMSQAQDTLWVSVVLSTGAGRTTTIDVPVISDAALATM